MSQLIDFDAFRAEQHAEPVKLVIGGETYLLPPSMPAAMALDVIRLNADDPEKAVRAEDLEKMGAALFGGTLFREVVEKHGVTMSELPDLLRMVIGAYNGGTAPNRAARRAAGKRGPTTPS